MHLVNVCTMYNMHVLTCDFLIPYSRIILELLTHDIVPGLLAQNMISEWSRWICVAVETKGHGQRGQTAPTESYRSDHRDIPEWPSRYKDRDIFVLVGYDADFKHVSNHMFKIVHVTPLMCLSLCESSLGYNSRATIETHKVVLRDIWSSNVQNYVVLFIGCMLA